MSRPRRQRWIVVEGWDRFQHNPGAVSSGQRRLLWIKNYIALLHNDNYLSLTLHQRGLLHSLWLAYATSNRQLIDNSSTLYRQIGHRVLRRDLEALNRAGFIRFSGTRPVSTGHQEITLEEKRERELRSLSSPSKPPSRQGRHLGLAGTTPPTAKAAGSSPATRTNQHGDEISPEQVLDYCYRCQEQRTLKELDEHAGLCAECAEQEAA